MSRYAHIINIGGRERVLCSDGDGLLGELSEECRGHWRAITSF